VGGSGIGNYTRIQDAIDNASNGDTVFVYNDSSPYYENIDIEKSISLIGEERFSTKIVGTVTTVRDNITVMNFSVENNTDDGFRIWSNNNLIKNNRICNNKRIGISISGSHNIIEKNYFNNNNWLGVDEEAGVTIWHYGTHNVIVDNFFENSILYAICVYGQKNKIIHNDIINVTNVGYSASYKVGIEISGGWNDLNQELYQGNNTVVMNSIENCGTGIRLSGENKATIHHNIVKNCIHYGISVFGSKGNRICHNTILNCGNNSIYGGFSFLNKWDGNYWGEPRTLPYIIIGKLYLFIPWFNVDWFPAQEPYPVEW
jgi:parallel beta-helix repeat protein